MIRYVQVTLEILISGKYFVTIDADFEQLG